MVAIKNNHLIRRAVDGMDSSHEHGPEGREELPRIWHMAHRISVCVIVSPNGILSHHVLECHAMYTRHVGYYSSDVIAGDIKRAFTGPLRGCTRRWRTN